MTHLPPPAPSEAEPSAAPSQDLLLREHVRSVLQAYFARLDGHAVSDLYEMVMNEVERPLIHTVLEHYGFNQSKAAQALGLSRSTLRKKINQHGLE